MLQARLDQTERRISQLKHHVDQQRSVIFGLEAARRGSTETAEIARDLLRTMEQNVGRETAYRTWLRAQLPLSAPRATGSR